MLLDRRAPSLHHRRESGEVGLGEKARRCHGGPLQYGDQLA
jgi:hypothetical protein